MRRPAGHAAAHGALPDTVEVLRSGAVDDALGVAALVADVTPRVTDPAALAVLGEAAAFADRHVDALGGVYDSGLEHPRSRERRRLRHHRDRHPGAGTTTPGTDGTASDPGAAGTGADAAGTDAAGTPAPGTATTDDVVTALVGAAERTGAAADASPDARLARLLASVAASEHVSAQRLAAATGSTVAAGPDEPPPVDEAPGGVGAADLATLVESEDAAGYGYEVRAAQSEGDVRTAAVARAAQHRARAQGWALAAGTDGTPQDPRRVAYALPDDTDPAAFARHVESGLARTYASLVAAAALTSRPRPSRCSRTPGRTPSRGASRPWRSRPAGADGRLSAHARRTGPAAAPARRTAPPTLSARLRRAVRRFGGTPRPRAAVGAAGRPGPGDRTGAP